MLSKPNILVCSDFSSYSDQALKEADMVRKKTHGKLHVLHVSPYPVVWDWIPNEIYPNYIDSKFEANLLDSLTKKLEQQMRALHVQGEGRVTMGVPPTVIIQEVTDKKYDLVIMGHKGRSSETFSLGSLAERIISSCPVPVLVVKGHMAMDKIAALVDPNGPMDQLLRWSEELSFLFSSRLEIVSLFPDIASRYIAMGRLGFRADLLNLNDEQKHEVVMEVKERIKRHMTKYAEADIKVGISTEKKLAYHLNNILEQDKIDLAIMKRHQAEFMEKVLIGSETRRMLEIFPGNLFIIPP